jgi:hypothetical protein
VSQTAGTAKRLARGQQRLFPPKWTSGMGYPTIRPNPHRYKARAPNDGQEPILET